MTPSLPLLTKEIHSFENYLLSLYYVPVIVLNVTHIVGNKSEKNPGTDILVSRHIVNKEIYNNLGPFLFKDVFREVGNGEVDHA